MAPLPGWGHSRLTFGDLACNSESTGDRVGEKSDPRHASLSCPWCPGLRDRARDRTHGPCSPCTRAGSCSIEWVGGGWGRRVSREVAETAQLWSRSRKGTLQRDHKRWLGGGSPVGPKATASGTATQHGLEAFARSSGTRSSRAPFGCRSTKPQPHSKGLGGEINPAGGEANERQEPALGSAAPAGVLRCARQGPALPPCWGRGFTCASQQNRSNLHTFFFSPAAAPKELGSIHGANLGREHPPVGTGRPVGAPHRCSLGAGHRGDPGVGAAWQGRGARGLGAAGAEQLRPRACTHRILLQSDAAPGERKPDPPPRPWAPAERCPRDRGLSVARSASAKNAGSDVGP